MLLSDMGEIDLATNLLESLVSEMSRTLERDHPATLEVIGILGLTYIRSNDHVVAGRELLVEAYDSLSLIGGANVSNVHPRQCGWPASSGQGTCTKTIALGLQRCSRHSCGRCGNGKTGRAPACHQCVELYGSSLQGD